ncbi:DUF4084 domain-containing protein [Neobacillus sp. LXY-4]|uniref:DUF4084 domain-containing protein n=1 Tax=Neobacillus sp. LXY-4 TaxID=3379826 RepID=UPI003EE1D0D4
MSMLKKFAPIFIIIYILLYYIWLYLWKDHSEMIVFGGNLFQSIGPLIAFSLLFNTFLKTKNSDRYFWLILSAGCLFFFLGQGIWIFNEFVLHNEPPYPGWPDVFWVIQYVLYLSAFLFIMHKITQTLPTIRFLFDIMIIMIAAITLSWDLVIDPLLTMTANSHSWLFTLVYVGYPIFDIGLLFGAISLFVISNGTIPQKAIIPIVLAFLIKVIANSGYTYLVVNNSYSTGSLLDPLWSLSLLLIGFSGLYAEVTVKENEKVTTIESFLPVRYFLPYLLILILFIFEMEKHHSIMDVMTIGLFVTLSLIMIRQIIILIKNQDLLNNHQRLSEELLGKNLQLEKMNQSLLEKEQQLTDVFNNLDAVIWSRDLRTNSMMISTGFEKLYGFSRRKLLERPSLWKEVIHPEDIYRANEMDRFILPIQTGSPLFEYRIIRPDETIKWVQVRRTPIFDEHGKLIKIHDVMTDITDRKKAEETIQHMAYYDELTGLPNRNLFYKILNQEMQAAKEGNSSVAIMFIDLDRFKSVNDTLGHHVGDLLLKEVTARLNECIGKNGTVCRLGGDEFTVILPSEIENDCEMMSIKILNSIDKTFKIEGHEIFVTPSIGISIYPEHGETEEELIKKADIAMYNAKDSGKNTYHFYNSGLDDMNTRKMKLENALRRAIEKNELFLHYQPKVELATGKILGLEALIRWTHPEFGIISPEEFIPLAEETGLIGQIGEWVLKKACYQNKTWQNMGLPSITISVNVSAHQLNEAFVLSVFRVLQETNLEPDCLELEITESVMQNISKSSAILKELKEIGIQISLDDFGTGYSSLSYLRHLPVNSVKIDKSFIQDILPHSNGGVMVKTIIDMGKNLNFNVIAEGVENPQQNVFLQQNNCYIGQGFLFSPPVPAENIVRLLREPISLNAIGV